MKTKFFGLALTLMLISVLFWTCDKKDEGRYKTKLRFISEEYKPFNFTSDSKASGLGPELLKHICNELNMDCEIEFLPWDEGYEEVLSTENTVLFSTVLTSIRKDKFKWAGPYASLDWNFYSSSQNRIEINSLEEAKTAGKIGVIAEYAIEQYLVSEGFTNLVYCTDVNDCVSKLLNGEIDLYPNDKYTTESALKAIGKTIYSVKSVFTLKTELIYFAFNKNVPDDVVADFQEIIDLAKKYGKLKELSEQYLQTSDYPDIMQIYTEPYPPLTYRNLDGEITGFGTDIVKEIMKRNGIYNEIKLSSWGNGYQMALSNPNFCLYTMDRTEIREDLFQWVGPVGTNTTWIYTKTGSGIVLNTLDDAKKLNKIGVVNSWFSTQFLEKEGFSNLVYESTPEVLAEDLIEGKIDGFVCTDITLPNILESIEFEYSDVNPSFAVMSSDFYIAFSKNTPASTVNIWKTTLEEIKSDGTYEEIFRKWFPQQLNMFL